MNEIVEKDLNVILSKEIEWNKFEDKNILITGANGMLASYIAMTLLYLNKKLKRKCRVYALVRNKEKAKQKFRDFSNDECLIFIEQDICKKIEIDITFDYIFHAASQASSKYYGVDPVGTLNANILGTNNILEMCKDKRIESFLFFSTSEIYGELPDTNFSISEKDSGYIDCTNIRSSYSESKRMGENMCVSWFEQYKVPSKIVRIFHTYGPGLNLDDGRVFSDFIKNIIKKEDIQMKSDGKTKRSFCYISDAIYGFFKIILDGENGEAYNLGNPKTNVSILELAQKLIEIYPEKKLKIKEIKQDKTYLKSPIKMNCPCIEKLRKLKWEPKISIEEGFKRTIESIEKER